MPVFSVTVTVEDANTPNPNSSTWGFNTVSADLADALSDAQAIVEAAHNPTPAGGGALPLALGRVSAVSITIPVDIAAWQVRTSANVASENQKGGKFIWNVTAPYRPTMFTIPTFNEALKLSSGEIDTANVAVSSFIAAIQAAGGANYVGQDITGLKAAVYTYGGKPATN